jgi:hypothetical protein
MRARTAALALLLALALARPAYAYSASPADVRDLASRAQTDPSALDQLENIDEVGGVPVDIRGALENATPSELQQRLVALSGGASGTAYSNGAREQAQQILQGRRYRQPTLPRPFAGPLRRIGAVLQRFFGAIFRHFPGPHSIFWILVALVVAAVTIAVVRWLGRRRRFAEHVQRDAVRLKDLRPDDLERAARDAEAAGRYADAVRLRFLAGLLRLDHAGAIRWHPSITSGVVRRRLGSKRFDNVASSFERITYGGRPATEDDLELSTSGWRDVLSDASR